MVIEILVRDNLPENAFKQGAYLKKCLIEELGDHPNVGDIRGRGLFLGLEFVKDKRTKKPFNPKHCVGGEIASLSLSNP